MAPNPLLNLVEPSQLASATCGLQINKGLFQEGGKGTCRCDLLLSASSSVPLLWSTGNLARPLVNHSHSHADGWKLVSRPSVSVLHASLWWGPLALVSQPSHYTPGGTKGVWARLI